jgi:hypothetical protein
VGQRGDRANWREVRTRLFKSGWEGTRFTWWKLESPTVRYPPRFKKARKLIIEDHERGLHVMREIGIFTLTVPPQTDPWPRLPSVIRAYWRSMFLYIAGLTRSLRVSPQETSRMFQYLKASMPFIWQVSRKPRTFVRAEKFPPCQPGFFARMFDAASEVRRHGLDYLYSVSGFRQALEFSNRAYNYAREKYPWLTFSRSAFFAHVLVDCLCEHLWFREWKPKDRRKIYDLSLQRVFMDFFDRDPIAKAYERYCTRITHEIVHAPILRGTKCHQKINLWRVEDALYEQAEPWYNFPTMRRHSRVFTTTEYPRYEKLHCDPTFLRLDRDRTILDPNWVKYPNQRMLFPRILQVLRFSIPAIPVIPAIQGELYQLILGCMMKDRFFFHQRRWYVAVPVFLREDDVWYMNSSFYDFGRAKMAAALRDIMQEHRE